MTNITRRSAIGGAGAAILAAGLPTSGSAQTPASESRIESYDASECLRLMRELSAALDHYSDGQFRAIVEPTGAIWFQSTDLPRPFRNEVQI